MVSLGTRSSDFSRQLVFLPARRWLVRSEGSIACFVASLVVYFYTSFCVARIRDRRLSAIREFRSHTRSHSEDRLLTQKSLSTTSETGANVKRKRYSLRLRKERLVRELIQEFYLPDARVWPSPTGFLRIPKAVANQHRVKRKSRKIDANIFYQQVSKLNSPSISDFSFFCSFSWFFRALSLTGGDSVDDFCVRCRGM